MYQVCADAQDAAYAVITIQEFTCPVRIFFDARKLKTLSLRSIMNGSFIVTLIRNVMVDTCYLWFWKDESLLNSTLKLYIICYQARFKEGNRDLNRNINRLYGCEHSCGSNT